jgi:hypothetical protein
MRLTLLALALFAGQTAGAAENPKIPPCGCGCMKTGMCQCKNCCERTADPNWKPEDSKTAAAQIARPVGGAQNAMAEVNAARAARGLRPFVEDPELTAAAMQCADFRAARLMAGHTISDFSALRPGVSASASGCAAWPAWMGWGSCCWEDDYLEAGAAFTVGPDNLRYMHIFVRGGSGASGGATANAFGQYQPVQRRGLFGRRR